DSLPKYRAAGIDNVLLSQWACNRYAYSKVTDEIQHQVNFVGQPHGNRELTIERLRAAGHEVECWGFGWPAGRLSHEQMVEVFASSPLDLIDAAEHAARAHRTDPRAGSERPPARPDQGPQLRGSGVWGVPADRAGA